MITRHQKRIITITIMCFVTSLPFMVGCGGKNESIANKTEKREGKVGTPAIPIMLHGKQASSKGRSVTLNMDRISQVKFHDISDPAEDGSYTATVSFRQKQTNGAVRVKLKVTYKIEKLTSSSGLVVENYPVSKLSTISIENAKLKK
jgi:hypothetical protein